VEFRLQSVAKLKQNNNCSSNWLPTWTEAKTRVCSVYRKVLSVRLPRPTQALAARRARNESSLGLAPLLVVEQNARAALGIADRGYVLENGRITVSGNAADLLDNQIVQDAYLGGQGGSSRAVEQRIRAKRRQILG
jgi:hypothetical protein